MTTSDWVMCLAIVIGPLSAIYLARSLDNRKERRERKYSIFRALMATRGYTTVWDHVSALNTIDVEFAAKNKNLFYKIINFISNEKEKEEEEKAVIAAWRSYNDHLHNTVMETSIWFVKRDELLVELLYRMALALNYDFDKTYIKNSTYAPQVHANIDRQQEKMRQLTIELLEGNRSIPVKFTNTE